MFRAISKLAVVAIAGSVISHDITGAAKVSPSASATSKTATPAPVVLNCSQKDPPKVMPIIPKANSCWAGGFYLGNGSFTSRIGSWAEQQVGTSVKQFVKANPSAAKTVSTAVTQYETPGSQRQVLSAVQTAWSTLVDPVKAEILAALNGQNTTSNAGQSTTGNAG